MNELTIIDREFQDILDNDEYMKTFKKLTKDQQLAELSKLLADINGNNN